MLPGVMPEQNQMRLIVVLSVAVFFGSIAWFVAEPGYEPAIAVVVSLIALIRLCVTAKRGTSKTQHQKIERQGLGIQAGGDVKIGGDIKIK